jgi:hypothetical protein
MPAKEAGEISVIPKKMNSSQTWELRRKLDTKKDKTRRKSPDKGGKEDINVGLQKTNRRPGSKESKRAILSKHRSSTSLHYQPFQPLTGTVIVK